MFEEAIRDKYRFPYNGVISVEDLYDLSVENLDIIYKDLKSVLKEKTEDSLLDVKTKRDKQLDNKIEIIKYIVTTKQAEAKALLDSAEKGIKKQKILEILQAKQDENLKNMSEDELKKMVDEL